MICGTFARARLNAAQASEVAQGFRDNHPPPNDVRTTLAGDGTFTVTAVFPPCPAESTHHDDLPSVITPPILSVAQPTTPATPAAAGLPGSPSDFGTLVAGGFFSSQPNDHAIPRAIRTNNPSALNISDWQRSREGFVGVTESDGSSNNNRTTIYRTPEHGLASWWHLLAIIYGLSAKASFRLLELAQHYSGMASGQNVDNYVSGWSAKSGGVLNDATDINLNDLDDARLLARAMFDFEAGKPSPLHDDQIDFGIINEKANTLPP